MFFDDNTWWIMAVGSVLTLLAVSLFGYANNRLDTKCRAAGGQIIVYTDNLGHACAYPASK